MMDCAGCGATFTGRKRKFCTDQCRRTHYAGIGQAKVKAELRSRLGEVPCSNPYCDATLVPLRSRMFCSKPCQYVGAQIRSDGRAAGEAAAIKAGQLAASRIYYFDCADCGSIVVKSYKRAGKWPCCRPCARRRYLEHMARKNHKRRASGPKVLSVFQIAERDGCRCNICGKRVDLALPGSVKWGPTIDHLMPVSKGGTNDPSNLALAHRHCNTLRGNRGHVQLQLSA